MPRVTRDHLGSAPLSTCCRKAARTVLAGKANVHRAPANCGPTASGLKNIEAWLGDGTWDVIHFNFGLWDMYGWEYARDDRSPEAYEKRLETLVKRLEQTGAQLIWATTTPACPT